jgi:hypothetical protein
MGVSMITEVINIAAPMNYMLSSMALICSFALRNVIKSKRTTSVLLSAYFCALLEVRQGRDKMLRVIFFNIVNVMASGMKL